MDVVVNEQDEDEKFATVFKTYEELQNEIQMWAKISPVFAKIDSFDDIGIMTISFDKNITIIPFKEVNPD